MHVTKLKSLESVDAGDPSNAINIVVEIPKGSSIKYEFDAATGQLFVDRKLYTAMNYPFNYGFIPRTLEMDGDPVDALILGEDPVVPLSIVKSRPIGVLLTEDEEGQDSKVIATPLPKIDPTFTKIGDIKDLPQYVEDQIKHFFEHYKELEEGKFVKVKGWEGKDGAVKKITESIQRYRGMEK